MTADRASIECAEHGRQDQTVVCRHIVWSLEDNLPYGFFWADDPGNPRPHAWCTACDLRLKSTGGVWTSELFDVAGPRVLCGACYDQARALSIPQSGEGGEGPIRRFLRRLWER